MAELRRARAEPRVGRLYVGTSGYHYEDWAGRFYPADLSREDWFEYYATHFDTLEINASFYGLPERKTFQTWRERAPKGFVQAVKFSSYGTHRKRLLEARSTIGRFLERAEALGPTLGPILVQLPPRFRVNVERLDTFLSYAPADYRWAVEFRDPSWLCDPIYEVLEAHAAALVVHDRIDDHPRRLTTDWTYLRFHGDDDGGHYSSSFLVAEANRISKHLEAGRDVYAYFDNDKQAAATKDAQRLRRYVDRRVSGEV